MDVHDGLLVSIAFAPTAQAQSTEQLLRGETDGRTDIYAAGSVLYEMATGQQPFAQMEPSQRLLNVFCPEAIVKGSRA
jgi:serine/threonine protein kinase